jgi:hypothetical protein
VTDDSTIVVRRRFPVCEGTLRTNRSCDFVLARLRAAFDFDDASSFVLRAPKRGIHGSFRPFVEGSILPGEAGGCDVRFRVRYPAIWWVLDIVLFVLLAIESYTLRGSYDPFILVPCMAILVLLSFVPLSLKGWVFARRVKALIATDG